MVIPSILEKNIKDIQDKVAVLDKNCTLFQIDVSDGKLVHGDPTFTDITKLGNIPTDSNFELDLMVERPDLFVEKRVTNVFKICANIKASKYITDFIQKAKELDYITGISVNLDTPLNLIDPLVPIVDFIQFMGVEAGAQGRNFNKKVIAKIKEFKEKYPKIETQLDGGINHKTIPSLLDLGIKDFIIGSAIFEAQEPEESYIKFKETAHDTTNNIFGDPIYNQ